MHYVYLPYSCGRGLKHLWRAVSKQCGFGQRIHCDSCGRKWRSLKIAYNVRVKLDILIARFRFLLVIWPFEKRTRDLRRWHSLALRVSLAPTALTQSSYANSRAKPVLAVLWFDPGESLSLVPLMMSAVFKVIYNFDTEIVKAKGSFKQYTQWAQFSQTGQKM